MGGHEVIRFWRDSSEWGQVKSCDYVRRALQLRDNTIVLGELEELHKESKADLWLLHNVVPVISLGVYSLGRRLEVKVVQWLHNYRPISIGGAMRYRGKRILPEHRGKVIKEVIAGTWRGRFASLWLATNYWWLKWNGDFDSVAAWVAVSHSMKRTFERSGWYPEKLHVLHHSWDIEDQFEGNRAGNYYLFLGRLIEEKGVLFLLDIWRSHQIGAELVIAGTGELAAEIEIGDNPSVRYEGYVTGEAKKALISGATAILFPSLWEEPLSTVAYEAYQQSRPVITSDAGGMSEIVIDGETGLVFPAGSKAGCVKAIKELENDRSAADHMGRRGRKWLEETVSPVSWNRGFDEIVNRI